MDLVEFGSPDLAGRPAGQPEKPMLFKQAPLIANNKSNNPHLGSVHLPFSCHSGRLFFFAGFSDPYLRVDRLHLF